MQLSQVPGTLARAWGCSTSERPIAPRAATAERLIRAGAAISDRRMTLGAACPVLACLMSWHWTALARSWRGDLAKRPSSPRSHLYTQYPARGQPSPLGWIPSCLPLRHSACRFSRRAARLSLAHHCSSPHPHRLLCVCALKRQTTMKKKKFPSTSGRAHCPSGRTTAIARIANDSRPIAAHPSPIVLPDVSSSRALELFRFARVPRYFGSLGSTD